MRPDWVLPCDRAVIATRHGKEAAIQPALRDLELNWLDPPTGFDTDRFGTFTRDVPRAGTQLDAALAKARAALDACPQARFAIASEGAFGPHPAMPFVTGGRELVLLVDREALIELHGTDLTYETNFAQTEASGWNEVENFASRVGFPQSGIVFMMADDQTVISKDIADWEKLRDAVDTRFERGESVWLEADMRAHRNPLRMASIGRAATQLSKACRTLCSECGHPGWIPRAIPGRPCEWCGAPTTDLWQEKRSCMACGHEDIRTIDPERPAKSGFCPHCNP